MSPLIYGLFVQSLRCAEKIILGGKRPQGDSDITYMPAVIFPSRLDIERKSS